METQNEGNPRGSFNDKAMQNYTVKTIINNKNSRLFLLTLRLNFPLLLFFSTKNKVLFNFRIFKKCKGFVLGSAIGQKRSEKCGSSVIRNRIEKLTLELKFLKAILMP
jgi:hypothetical protein